MADGIETLVADQSRWAPVESVRLTLERHYDRSHRLADLATHARMSEAHLCRQFKAYTGLSPFAYLAQRRIDSAKQLLRNSSRKILDIAFTCGFNDIGHFNRKFRQLAGCAPSHYRAGAG
ncbi:MAG: helix-turn-helix transcriptional regulator [Kiritimatiellia bacterium]|jgi:AraC family transcriptional regulator|nr:helix-turn-helix transcriptional regulator [Kiritimatiellia bacterium]